MLQAKLDEKLDLRMGFAGGAGGKNPTSCVDRRRVSGGSLREPAEALCGHQGGGGGQHLGGHLEPPGRVDVPVGEDGGAQVVGVQLHEGDVLLEEEGEGEAAVPEAVYVVSGGVQSYGGDPGLEPSVELVLAERSPGPVALRQLKDQVGVPDVVSPSHVS